MKMKFLIGILFAMLFAIGGCSNNDEPVLENQKEETRGDADINVYYYDGYISLDNGDNGDKVYRISGPMMYPMEYGNIIPIPLLDYNTTSVVEIDLGDNTLIEENSVVFMDDEEKKVENLPIDGVKTYAEYLTIERISKDVVKVVMQQCYDKEVKIITKPIPFQMYDFKVDKWIIDFKPQDYNLPDTVAIALWPHMFLDRYRPIRQDRMTVY